MGFKNFRLNSFTFTVNNLEIVFRHLVVTELTHYYIIMITRITLDGFIVGNAKSSIISAEKYFIIKKTLFAFRKKFMITNSRRKYY